MPNKHFCQGPHCHEKITQDRFLKSRGVIRGRYAYSTIDSNYGYWSADSDKYFCSQSCKLQWLSTNMKHIEHGRPIEFIRHRRETRGYQKITRDRGGLLGTYTTSSIQKVEGATE
jgi:hypothetical protein